MRKLNNSNHNFHYVSGSPRVHTSNIFPTRVVLHGHHPDNKPKEEDGGKLAHLPDSMEDLLELAGELI